MHPPPFARCAAHLYVRTQAQRGRSRREVPTCDGHHVNASKQASTHPHQNATNKQRAQQIHIRLLPTQSAAHLALRTRHVAQQATRNQWEPQFLRPKLGVTLRKSAARRHTHTVESQGERWICSHPNLRLCGRTGGPRNLAPRIRRLTARMGREGWWWPTGWCLLARPGGRPWASDRRWRDRHEDEAALHGKETLTCSGQSRECMCNISLF